jgi:hypothetical protein
VWLPSSVKLKLGLQFETPPVKAPAGPVNPSGFEGPPALPQIMFFAALS